MEEQSMERANTEINDELKRLIESMSGLNIEHERTINLCYAEYFDQKVTAFERVEKQIGSLVKSFYTNAKDSKECSDVQIAADVYKEREEFLLHVRDMFDNIEKQGFGIIRCYKSNNKSTNQTTPENQIKSKSGDNFCDFVFENVDNDNGIEMMGYGMATSEDWLTNNNNNNVPNKDNKPETDAFQPDEVNSFEFFPQIHNSNIPPRLRFKRRFSVMTKPVNSYAGDAYTNEMEVKRRRETQIF